MIKPDTPVAKAWADLCASYVAEATMLRMQLHCAMSALSLAEAGKNSEPCAAAVATLALKQIKDIENDG
jgi:hypothetical protein